MRESCTSGSVRGVLSNEHPYRDTRPRASSREDHRRAPCPPLTTDRVGTARAVKLA